MAGLSGRFDSVVLTLDAEEEQQQQSDEICFDCRPRGGRMFFVVVLFWFTGRLSGCGPLGSSNRTKDRRYSARAYCTGGVLL